MSLPRLKEKIYLSIIERSLKSQTNEAFLALIGADDPDNRFLAAAVRVLNLEEVRKSRFHEDSDLLHFAVANVINEIAGDHFGSLQLCEPEAGAGDDRHSDDEGRISEDIAYRSIHQMNKVGRYA